MSKKLTIEEQEYINSNPELIKELLIELNELEKMKQKEPVAIKAYQNMALETKNKKAKVVAKQDEIKTIKSIVSKIDLKYFDDSVLDE